MIKWLIRLWSLENFHGVFTLLDKLEQIKKKQLHLGKMSIITAEQS